jgi:hypothetical protein
MKNKIYCGNNVIENDIDESARLITDEFEVYMPSNEITRGPVTSNLNTITYHPLNLDVGINLDIIVSMENCAPIDFILYFLMKMY